MVDPSTSPSLETLEAMIRWVVTHLYTMVAGTSLGALAIALLRKARLVPVTPGDDQKALPQASGTGTDAGVPAQQIKDLAKVTSVALWGKTTGWLERRRRDRDLLSWISDVYSHLPTTISIAHYLGTSRPIKQHYVPRTFVECAPNDFIGGGYARSRTEIPESSLWQRMVMSPRHVFVIMGEPHSGKTCLTSNMAYRVGTRSRGARAFALVVRSSLREVTASISDGAAQPTLAQVCGSALTRSRSRAGKAADPVYLEESMRRRRVLVILEDLDDASSKQRIQLVTWLENEMCNYPQVTVVLTTRWHGYVDNPIRGAGCTVLRLLPLSKTQRMSAMSNLMLLQKKR